MRTRQTLFFLILTGILSPAVWAAASPKRSIDVVGEGEVKTKPDQVVLRFGIEISNPKLIAAKNENVRRTKSLLSSLKKAGIKEEKIQTTQIQIHPQYKYDRGERKFIGYKVRKDFTIEMSDIKGYGKVLNVALNAGVEHVSGVQFKTSKLETLKEKAREHAAKDAKKKAAILAGNFNQKIGKPIRIQD